MKNTTVILDEEQGKQLKFCMDNWDHILKLRLGGAFDVKLGRYTVDVDQLGVVRNVKLEINTSFSK